MEDNIKEVIKSFVVSGDIEESFINDDVVKDLAASDIIKILDMSYPLVYDEQHDILYYIDKNGEKFEAPDLSVGMSNSATWLCDKLPPITIDFEQGGNVRKSIEATSIYSLICLSVIITDIKKEFILALKEYDFNNMSFKDGSGLTTMRNFLEDFQGLNSLRINSIVSASNYNITRAQEKKEVIWSGLITPEELLELSVLSRDIKNIIMRYEREEKLNPSEINSLTKIQKLTVIDRRDMEINKVIDNSSCATLYRITKFNSERLTPKTKTRILRSCRTFANKVIKDKFSTATKIQQVEKFEESFRSLQKTLTRASVNTLIQREIQAYKKSPDSYVLRKKL